MTSKGQITVPKAVRDALGLRSGDDVMFRVEGDRAVLTRIPNFIDLAGTFAVPAEVRGKSWDEIRDATWAERAKTIG